MKFVIVAALALVALSSATPIDSAKDATIVRSESDIQPNGAYTYAVETSDGKTASETGELKSVVNEEGKPQDVIVARGQYSYYDEAGVLHEVSYVADENGFQAISADLPKGPEAVARR